MSKGRYTSYLFYETGGIWFRSSNTACFSGLNSAYIYSKDDIFKELKSTITPQGLYMYYLQPFKVFKECYVYIGSFEPLTTSGRLAKLIALIDKITPCKLIKTSLTKDTVCHVDSFKDYMDRELVFIKLNLLDSYDKNLILLNFIRNYWYSPIDNYSEDFFRILNTRELSKEKDPLKRLTKANKEACRLSETLISFGHSNIHDFKKLTIKSTEQLLEYSGYSTASFLTT